MERLQHAAMSLFLERGYQDVTVAEIAERAQLTRRTFFNHFADKREIFFAGAIAFQAQVVAGVANAPADAYPLDAAVAALTAAGAGLAKLAGEHASALRTLIKSSPELHERELAKMNALTDAVASALRERGASARVAQASARLAIAAFTDAWDDWTQKRSGRFSTPMRRRVADLRDVFDAADDR